MPNFGEHKRHDVKCKFGTVAVIPTDANHIYATSNPDSGRNTLPFNVRGVDYSVSAHVYRYKDGSWHVGPEKVAEYMRLRDGLYMSRRDYKDPSDAARQAAAAEIETVVRAWAAKNSSSLSFAEFTAAQSHLESLKSQRAEKAKELAAIDAEIKAATAELSRLK